ncbi:CS1 type fimbrial major subunit [Candidatus Williamhamiltonella defendens]|nr:CS1 type fimbrial major subunit [Candidatus Hamiltonella defensa]
MQPLKKTHLCVLKKYLAVAALSCAASVISVKSIAAKQDLDIKLTAQVPEKEFKLENKEIELAMIADTKKKIFTGNTHIQYSNANNLSSLNVKLINDPKLKLVGSVEQIGIESISIDNQKLGNDSGINLTQDAMDSSYESVPLEIISKSYKEVSEGTYQGTVTLQFDATISS